MQGENHATQKPDADASSRNPRHPRLRNFVRRPTRRTVPTVEDRSELPGRYPEGRRPGDGLLGQYVRAAPGAGQRGLRGRREPLVGYPPYQASPQGTRKTVPFFYI
jgi:hypothetical protein